MTDVAVGALEETGSSQDTATVQDTGLDQKQLEQRLEEHRVELTGYCYRMLGSSFEAEDAVQDAFVRAWRAYDRFQGRSSLRSWLYRIATNVCFDALDGRQRRARPMDMGPATTADTALGPELPEERWIQPMPDARVVPTALDPADLAVQRDSVRLAFLATLQHLPPKQRAVLILREVLQWQATEVATLLDTSVASVNSALQRARATLATKNVEEQQPQPALDDQLQGLLARYLDAFERYDLDTLTSLLHEDASWSMPPYELWLQTHEDIKAWCLGQGHACRGSKLVPIEANGAPGFAQYKPSGPNGEHEAWALQVVDLGTDGKLAGICFYLDTANIFPLFGLPLTYAELENARS